MLPFLQRPGPEQMALDWLLLDHSLQAGHQSGPILRFYGWVGPWLSLGRHQREIPPHWQALNREGVISMVRRPSGGGAVLHAGGLTYALIWPEAPRQRREAYRQTTRWLIDGVRNLGLELQLGTQPAEAGLKDCFASATSADLVDHLGHKRIGSAQYWRRGHLLQHGEIVLDPPPLLWQDLFHSTPPAPLTGCNRDDLIQALGRALGRCWPGVTWSERDLTAAAWRQVETLSEAYRREELPA